MEPGLHFSTAKDLFEAFPTAAAEVRGRPDVEAPLEFMAALADSPTPEEAITFGAYALPRRKAVWWGHQCLTMLDPYLSGLDRQMLQLAESWVREPEEAQRAEAMNQGMAAPVKSPGVWIALAAGWSGGSMSPPELPRVAPPPYLTPRATGVGILSVLALGSPAQRAETLRSFVDMGISLARR
jgi:hypothetical protein